MVVWRKRGWIILVMGLLTIGLPLELQKEYVGIGQLTLGVIFGRISWFLGKRWNKEQHTYSTQTGKFNWKDIFESGTFEEEVSTSNFGPEFSSSHSFCTVKMQYWAPVLGLVGLVCFILNH